MKHISILLAALAVVLGTHSFTRADAPAGVTRWEYKYISKVGSKTEEIEANLNQVGADGWELVTAFGGVVFKRPVR